MAVSIQKRAFSVEEFHAMNRAGLFRQDDRVELVDGEVIEMTPIGPQHAACVRRLNRMFHRRFAGSALVDIQNPVRLSGRTEVQPDVVLLKQREDFYGEGLPGPTDTLLVIEVADTSLTYDQDIKIPLYARSGIGEVWLVDLPRGVITVFRGPSPQGYRESFEVDRRGSIVPLALPDQTIEVQDILGQER
jgi:Uma2 family endonuclease